MQLSYKSFSANEQHFELQMDIEHLWVYMMPAFFVRGYVII